MADNIVRDREYFRKAALKHCAKKRAEAGLGPPMSRSEAASIGGTARQAQRRAREAAEAKAREARAAKAKAAREAKARSASA